MTTAQVNDFYRRHDPTNPFRDPTLPGITEVRFPWSLVVVTWMTVTLLLGTGMLAGMAWTINLLEAP